MSTRGPITTHILDTSLGKPASGVAVSLEKLSSGDWKEISNRATDQDGRIADLITRDQFTVGDYRLTFDVSAYFAATNRDAFFPSVTIEFRISNLDQHYHVPLLLSPFGYSTYRGS